MNMYINWIGVRTIFLKEIGRSKDVVIQAFLSPVISTALYFVVFGSAIGSRMEAHQSVPYAAFIVPGLILMALLMNALMAASSGIYFPRFIGTIGDLLSAPLSSFEIALGFALSAMARSLAIGCTIYIVAALLTPIPIAHPIAVIFLSLLVTLTFSLLGIALGIWAKDFEQLSIVPTLVLTPLSFLGGIFYSIEMLPATWQAITRVNPIFYMIDGLRWSFFGVSDTDPIICFALVFAFFVLSVVILARLFQTHSGLRQ